MSEDDTTRRLTWWSIATVVVALPVWWFAAIVAVMPRVVDGGIFLSVIGGLDAGLPLYSGVWDNKDPLFFVSMLAAERLWDTGPFVMDWLWLPLGALGGWLLSRRVTSPDRALAVGLVGVPLVLIAPSYASGWTNTPGTALALLVLGLAMTGRGVLAGVAVGVLAFTKLVVWPIGLACLLVLLLFPGTRRTGVRALTTGALTTAGIAAGLALVGWLAGYVDALGRNRTYSADVMTYFGFSTSPFGHLDKLRSDWATPTLVAAVAILLVLAVGWPVWLLSHGSRSTERTLLLCWLTIAVAGTAGTLALTYVWPHHVQAMFLPGALAVVVVTALLPERWPLPLALVIVAAAGWIAGGWGTPSMGLERVSAVRDSLPARWAEVGEVPTDSRLLATVPLRDFTYARLGTNDDRGYLLSARDDAALACPQFHLYDFSPPEDFDRMLQCIQDVDVVLMTDSFVVFGNGGRAASVQPILQYVDYAFTCLRVGDRQVCTRKPA